MTLRNLFLMLIPLMSACASDRLIMTGEASAPVEIEKVRLVFGEGSVCPYEVIAILEISSGNFSRASIVEEFRELAAEVGAEAVQIQYLRKRDVGEFLGQARALRCVDRANANQSSESESSSSSS